jgi:uncharacterized membrane protein YoaK (UPF0700 family)
LTRDERGHLALTVAFTAVAGFVDAIGFLRLNGLFLGFMSGNSTRFAVALARMRWVEAGRAGGLVLLFVGGVVVGASIGRAAGAWRRPAILVGEAMLLVLGMALGRLGFAGAVPLVLAMGVQNAALQKVGGIQVSVTYITGALVQLGERLADPGTSPRWSWTPHALLWLGLVIGGAFGATAYVHFGLVALAAPAGGALALGAMLAPRAGRGSASR